VKALRAAVAKDKKAKAQKKGPKAQGKRSPK
jgi:hypothetical protein